MVLEVDVSSSRILVLVGLLGLLSSGVTQARGLSGGGCCLESGECVDTTPESCEELGGEFAGMDLYCWRGDVQCDVEGRCCLPCRPPGCSRAYLLDSDFPARVEGRCNRSGIGSLENKKRLR